MRLIPIILTILFFLPCGTNISQAQKGKDVLSRIVYQQQEVMDYVVKVEVDLDMERLRIPRMKADLYFKKPNKYHITSESFAMIPREAVFLDPAKLLEEYDVIQEGVETKNDRKVTKLQLAAKSAETRVRQMHVWVDESNWTISEIEMIPFPRRNAKFEFTYQLYENRYWLPSLVIANLSTTETSDADQVRPFDRNIAPQLSEMRSSLREGTITIRYSAYQINKGISDDVFRRENEK